MNMYNDEQSILISKRLKELRESKDLTLEKLCNELNSFGVDIGIQSLKNYEVTDLYHTRFHAVDGMAIKTLHNLAAFYGVSTDYLLGLTDYKSPDENSVNICKATGLNEKAVTELCFMKHFNNKNDLETLSKILSHPLLKDILKDITQFQTEINKQHTVADFKSRTALKKALENFESENEDILQDNDYKLLQRSEYMKYSVYDIIKRFNIILDEVINQKDNINMDQ